MRQFCKISIPEQLVGDLQMEGGKNVRILYFEAGELHSIALSSHGLRVILVPTIIFAPCPSWNPCELTFGTTLDSIVELRISSEDNPKNVRWLRDREGQFLRVSESEPRSWGNWDDWDEQEDEDSEFAFRGLSEDLAHSDLAATVEVAVNEGVELGFLDLLKDGAQISRTVRHLANRLKNGSITLDEAFAKAKVLGWAK